MNTFPRKTTLCTIRKCQTTNKTWNKSVTDISEIHWKMIDCYYTPGGLALVGDNVEVGMASDFTGVVAETEATLIGPSFWRSAVVPLRLTSAVCTSHNQIQTVTLLQTHFCIINVVDTFNCFTRYELRTLYIQLLLPFYSAL